MTLLQRARQLDESALAQIFDRYYDALYRYSYYQTRHAQTSEDLAAQVFSRLLQALHAGNGPTNNLKAWLYRVARNLIVDDTRRQQYRNHAVLVDDFAAPDADPAAASEAALLSQQAYNALDALTPQQRDVLVLRFLSGLSPAETASILDMSVGAVKALQHRGLAALRRELLVEIAQEGDLS